MRIKMLAVAVLASGLTVSVVQAVPIATTTYGGHTYELFQSSAISWTDAEAAAVANGGYLAVLTDTAETTAVYGGLINNGFFQQTGGTAVEAWLGATPAVGTSTTDPNNWKWVDGEAWTAFDASNFANGEPNGDPNSGLAINRYGSFAFNDEGGTVGGYIVEFNSVPDAGLTAMLLGVGLIGVGTFRRVVKVASIC